MGAQLPVSATASQELLACLLDVRQRLDRMEELLASALQLRSLSAKQHTAARIIADDAWDQAATVARQSAVRDEYSSAKERTAATNLEVLDLRRAERRTDQLARDCVDAVTFLRLRYDGLAGIRQELLALIRARQFETTLDR
jgi:hypothetical protein